MQCVNCGLENVPGMQACARCQSRLEFGAVAVHPQRASRFRIQTRLGRLWHVPASFIRGALRGGSVGLRSVFSDSQVPWSAVFLSVVPGLGHLMRGHRLIGRLLMAGWAVLLVAAGLTMGTPTSWWFIMLAVSLHANAILSLMGAIQSGLGLFGRMVMGIALFGGLYLGLYWPVGQLGASVYVPLPLAGMMPNPVLQDGDAVLYNGPWTRPRRFARGDLVVYQIETDLQQYHAYVVVKGLSVDRVVGLPGDRVKLHEGQLLVNGRPPAVESLPLGSIRPLGSFEVQAGPDELVILPSSVKLNVHGQLAVGPAMGVVSKVPMERVLGRVTYRIQPWSRMGYVR
ncbi:MAG: hypothetical protein GXY55_19210 [Phycisphaerae bacterium]|nr:hypothetical protein [Phycisphaerae bacterium]